MILTITYEGKNTQDLGYLLYKNPNRPQVFNMNFGKAYVFYPEVSEERTTAALLLSIDPVDLVRGKEGSQNQGLFDYVNDRPYVASSFMSTAISSVFGTAMTGRADDHQELSDSPLDLTAMITMLPCRGKQEMLERVFAPLGYQVSYRSFMLDDEAPQWGESPYVELKLSQKIRLRDLLKHLYLLIPVFDRQKHYWVGSAEVDKLLGHGEEWLAQHPEKEFIVRRYFERKRSFSEKVLERLAGAEDMAAPDAEEISVDPVVAEKKQSLNSLRLEAVFQALKETGASSVIDMGCGEGRLLKLLIQEPQFVKIAGFDVAVSELEKAGRRLKLDQMNDGARERIDIFQSSIVYKDKRFSEYEAAAVVEVIEHLDLNRLDAFERILFGITQPNFAVLTTPNREYNEKYESLTEEMRHGDHRFEWSRAEFGAWGRRIAEVYGYEVAFSEIGETDEKLGAPTQMGVFTRCK